ncbi:MAG TPA: hypothetical protein DIT99_01605 [Candidatus Latescibacteria bacterium]|jgi:serine/threonine-protein kinase RsbW|nr:hypothetical protein [Candidatus Latescibacterota bacterium]
MTGNSKPSPADFETLEFTIASIPEKTTEVDRRIEHLTARIGYDDVVRGDIMIAVNEVVKNAILHGNKCDKSKMVTITCSCNPSIFRIHIRDNGTGFNQESVADPRNPDNLLKETGRGLLMIKFLMDEVDIDITDEGTRVTLVKYSNP